MIISDLKWFILYTSLFDHVITTLYNLIVVVMNSTFNFGTNIVFRKTVVYIEPTYGSRCQIKLYCSGLMCFGSHNNVTSAIVSTFNSIEFCIAYDIDMTCTT